MGFRGRLSECFIEEQDAERFLARRVVRLWLSWEMLLSDDRIRV
jgi:hypothetical protein